MDPIIDAVMEDPQPPPPVTPPPVTTRPVTPASSTEGMVLIPAGEFRMGSNSGSSNEKPVHSVYVDAFYMDKYEVTNAQYAAFLNAKGKHTRKWQDVVKYWCCSCEGGNTWLDIGDGDERIEYVAGVYRAKGGYENHPVIYVSWHGAVAYSKWKGKRLLTEAEWEKAARGNLSGLTYPWGNSIDSSKANYNNRIKDTTAVGKYTANGYGLYDMAGNVWEWCLDEYNSGFYAVSSSQNPLSGANSIRWILDNYTGVKSSRVLRGGSWLNAAQDVRVADRSPDAPSGTSNGLGFRCARAVTP
jgi:formylglycine-generating enzyme required for sulfatase activity